MSFDKEQSEFSPKCTGDPLDCEVMRGLAYLRPADSSSHCVNEVRVSLAGEACNECLRELASDLDLSRDDAKQEPLFGHPPN